MYFNSARDFTQWTKLTSAVVWLTSFSTGTFKGRPESDRRCPAHDADVTKRDEVREGPRCGAEGLQLAYADEGPLWLRIQLGNGSEVKRKRSGQNHSPAELMWSAE